MLLSLLSLVTSLHKCYDDADRISRTVAKCQAHGGCALSDTESTSGKKQLSQGQGEHMGRCAMCVTFSIGPCGFEGPDLLGMTLQGG